MPKVLHDVGCGPCSCTARSGVSGREPFVKMLVASPSPGDRRWTDGVHKPRRWRGARCAEYEPVDTLVPVRAYRPERRRHRPGWRNCSNNGWPDGGGHVTTRHGLTFHSAAPGPHHGGHSQFLATAGDPPHQPSRDPACCKSLRHPFIIRRYGLIVLIAPPCGRRPPGEGDDQRGHGRAARDRGLPAALAQQAPDAAAATRPDGLTTRVPALPPCCLPARLALATITRARGLRPANTTRHVPAGQQMLAWKPVDRRRWWRRDDRGRSSSDRAPPAPGPRRRCR